MVDVTIGELLQEAVADQSKIIFETLSGFTKRDTALDVAKLGNAETLFTVESQADLEAALGTTLDIPDNEARTIVYQKSFTQTKPFLLGVGSTIELYVATNKVNITITGSSLAEMKTPGTSGATLSIPSILRLTGDGTNKVFDLKLTGGANFDILIATNFQDFGTINIPTIYLSLQ